MFGHGPQKCVSGRICGKALAIEFNGDLFSCDHFVYPEYKLGNIREVHEGDLAFSEQQKKFAYAKSKTLPQPAPRLLYLELLAWNSAKEPFRQNTRWRKGLELPLSRLEKILCQGDGRARRTGKTNGALSTTKYSCVSRVLSWQ